MVYGPTATLVLYCGIKVPPKLTDTVPLTCVIFQILATAVGPAKLLEAAVCIYAIKLEPLTVSINDVIADAELTIVYAILFNVAVPPNCEFILCADAVAVLLNAYSASNWYTVLLANVMPTPNTLCAAVVASPT